MTETSNNSALQRLERLEGYLREDPQNQRLRLDAFETALLANQWERAEFHLRHGQSTTPDPLRWALHEVNLLLAQQRYVEAVVLLQPLTQLPQPVEEFANAVLQNLAYAEFQQGNYKACIDQLVDILALEKLHAKTMLSQSTGLQQMWLRALHRETRLTQAMDWTFAAEATGVLSPQAAGIASLIAIDADDFAAAQRWSASALSQATANNSQQIETLVTQSSLKLAGLDHAGARQWADAALQLNQHDGRAWSARAFASLLAGDMDAAVTDFAQALYNMPEHIGTWHGQGWAHVMQRNLSVAQESFATALAMNRNFAESHGGLAVVLALQGQRSLAQEHIDRALRLDSNNLSGRYAQAIVNGEVQDVQNLRRFAQRLLSRHSAPLGGQMSDWLAQKEPSTSREL